MQQGKCNFHLILQLLQGEVTSRRSYFKTKLLEKILKLNISGQDIHENIISDKSVSVTRKCNSLHESVQSAKINNLFDIYHCDAISCQEEFIDTI